MKNIKDAIWDFVEILFIGVFIIALTFWFIGQPVQVSGSSMFPTLKDKQQIISEKLTYKLAAPQRQEIALIKHPDNPSSLVVKRIIALPGDTFEIKNNNVYINGDKLEENYLSENTLTKGRNKIKENTPVELQSTEYIVLGDNREDSMDSRNWGLVDESQIVGKAILVYAPFSEFKILQ